MKKLALGAAIALAIGAFSVLPASAGTVIPMMTATPDPATTTETVTVANEEGSANTCELPPSEAPTPQGLPLTAQVDLVIEDPDGVVVFDDIVSADGEGNWSVTVGPFETLGVYDVNAECYSPFVVESVPSASADFVYVPTSFEVIAQPASTTTTSSTTTSSTPGSSTTSTTKAAVATKTTPRFTG